MTKTFNLKLAAGNGINGDGITLCCSLTSSLFPKLANGGKVTVSTTRQHRKGEMKFGIIHEGDCKCPYLIINGKPIQITCSTYQTLRETLKFDNTLIHIFVRIH